MVKGRDTSDFTGWLWKPENSRLQRAGRQAAEATGGTQTGCAHPEGLPSAGLWSRVAPWSLTLLSLVLSSSFMLPFLPFSVPSHGRWSAPSDLRYPTVPAPRSRGT